MNKLKAITILLLWTASGVLFFSPHEVWGQEKVEETEQGEANLSDERDPLFDPDRLFLGGNLGFGFSAGGVYLNLSPLVGYRITDRWHGGFGATYIYQKATICYNKYQCNEYSTSVYGWRVFSRYFVLSKLFAYGEYESLNLEVPAYNGATWTYERRFIPSLLVGVGFSGTPFESKASWYILVLYDVLQHPYSVYRSSGYLVIRGGFSIGL